MRIILDIHTVTLLEAKFHLRWHLFSAPFGTDLHLILIQLVIARVLFRDAA